MKTNTRFLGLCSLLFTGLSLLVPALPAQEKGNTTSVKLSAPNQPATLRIDLPWADVHVTGVDGDTVTVASSLKKQGADRADAGGLRRLDDESSFELTEHDNIVTLHLASTALMDRGSDTVFNISLPRTMSLDARLERGGGFTAQDLSGDIEINSTNGAVHLDGLRGSAIVSSMNGEVLVSFASAPQKPVSLAAMNGQVQLRVPADTKANVQLRTQNGSIYTDFDNGKLKTRSEGKSSGLLPAHPSPDLAPGAPPAPLPPLTGGKLVSGPLNGGGVEIKISCMNGRITLRQSKSSSVDSTKDNVTVTFLDPDKFTDVDEDFPGSPSTAYLGVLRDYVQQTAAPLLPAGSKLTVTFLDIDLAGMIRPDKNNIRILTSTTIPRAHIRFQLTGADGQVLKEGERRLSEMNYQMNIGIIGRNEELYYDKELLRDWIYREFPKGS